MYDYIIIGGGISGLYCAIHLTNVLVLEESTQWGGRIKKHYHPNYHVGSGRFHKTHKLLWNLIKKFNLTPVKMPRTLDSDTIHEEVLSVEDYLTNIIRLWTRHDNLKNKPFYDRCVSVLGEADAVHFVYALGYHEMYYNNAYDSLHSFNMNYCQDDYYVLKEGMMELCIRMVKSIKGTCVLNHSVKTIKKSEGYMNVDGYKGKKVIITIPPLFFKYFPILSQYASLTLAGPPLLRIYVKYLHPVWFESLELDIFKQLIPMHDGILMIVYMKEEDIMKFIYMGKLKLESEIIVLLWNELSILFPLLKIPQPCWVKPYLWNMGIHGWIPCKLKELEILPDIENENVLVCGEAFSTRQSWIEGALESAESIIQSCINK